MRVLWVLALGWVVGSLAPASANAGSTPALSSACKKAARKLSLEVSHDLVAEGGPWAPYHRVVWLFDASEKHSGLLVWGDGGAPESYAAFLVPEEKDGIPKAEQALLLECAGYVPFESGHPRDGLAAAPRWGKLWPRGSKAPADIDDAEDAVLLLRAVPARKLVLRPGRERQFRVSWAVREDVDKATAPSIEGARVACPCHAVFDGPSFQPTPATRARRQEALTAWGDAWMGRAPRPWVIQTNLARDTVFAVGVRGRGRRVTWVGLHEGPVRVLTKARGRWWLLAQNPMAGGPALYAYHTLRSKDPTLQRILIQGVDAEVVEAGSTGLVMRYESGLGDDVRVSVDWDDLVGLLQRPGATFEPKAPPVDR